MHPLSVVIITFNEEANIRNCIMSVKNIASEVLVLDSGSTDHTVNIAKLLGARVETHPFDGHIQQKNRAKEMATHNWVLSLDADERITPELSNAIAAALESPTANGYSMNRLNHYCGKPIKGCGWYPDQKLRLWQKDSGNWGGTNPHDKFLLHEGNQGYLNGDILHFTYKTKEAMVEQSFKFARIAAKEFSVKSTSYLVFKMLFSSAFKFIKTFFFQQGFLFGKDGYEICLQQAIEVFTKYKLALTYKINPPVPVV